MDIRKVDIEHIREINERALQQERKRDYNFGYNDGINNMITSILENAYVNNGFIHIRQSYIEELGNKLKEENIKKVGL